MQRPKDALFRGAGAQRHTEDVPAAQLPRRRSKVPLERGDHFLQWIRFRGRVWTWVQG